jgi:hypothetical protein
LVTLEDFADLHNARTFDLSDRNWLHRLRESAFDLFGALYLSFTSSHHLSFTCSHHLCL